MVNTKQVNVKIKIKCNDCGALFVTNWGSEELRNHQEGHKFKGFSEVSK